MVESFPRCALCDGASRPCFAAGEYRMYRCDRCATAFVSPTPTRDQLARFYDQFHLSAEEGGWYDQVESRMQDDFPAKIAVTRAAVGPAGPGRLLDVGCGKGYFVKACVEAGIDAEGVDLSETGVRFAREKLGVKATAGLLEEVGDQLGQFDTATFWATIEHVPDPVQTLRSIRRILRPGGALLLDTGIGADWLDRLSPARVQWYDPPQHLWVFSAPGMRAALNKAGFDVASLDGCFERSRIRRVVRIARNGAAAIGLRAVWAGSRLNPGEFAFTRVPMGNLMSVVAKAVG